MTWLGTTLSREQSADAERAHNSVRFVADLTMVQLRLDSWSEGQTLNPQPEDAHVDRLGMEATKPHICPARRSCHPSP